MKNWRINDGEKEVIGTDNVLKVDLNPIITWHSCQKVKMYRESWNKYLIGTGKKQTTITFNVSKWILYKY